MADIDPIVVAEVDGDSLRSWVAEREAALIAAEDEMLAAARNQATTDEERRYWEDLLALRARNVAAQRREP